jgi:hypothetical protein
MAASGINTLLQTLREVIHSSINNFLWDCVPRLHQTLLQGFNRLVGFRARFGLQNAPQLGLLFARQLPLFAGNCQANNVK